MVAAQRLLVSHNIIVRLPKIIIVQNFSILIFSIFGQVKKRQKSEFVFLKCQFLRFLTTPKIKKIKI